MKIRTVIALKRMSFPDRPISDESKEVFSPEEIDQLNPAGLAGKPTAKLDALQKKLSDTYDDLYEPYDCEVNSPEWRKWEERLDRLTRMMDAVDEIMDDGKGGEKDDTDGEE